MTKITSRITREMMTSAGGGRISLFKVGTAISILVGSWIMVYETIHARMTWQYFVVYLFSIGGFTQLGAFMARYYGGSNTSAPTPTEPNPPPADIVTSPVCPNCPTNPPKEG